MCDYYKRFCEETGTNPREKDFNWLFHLQLGCERHHRDLMRISDTNTISAEDAVCSLMIKWVNSADEHAIELSWADLAEVMAFKSKTYMWCVCLGKAMKEDDDA